MSENGKSKDRIPYEVVSDDQVSSWALPAMQGRGKLVKSASREKTPSSNESIEKVSKSKKPKQLTAEELQRISEEARQEGFKQGLDEGKQKGLEEGRVTGEREGSKHAYTEAKQDIEALQRHLTQVSTSLFDPMQGEQEQFENLLVDISLRLAQRLIDAEISANPALLKQLVSKVITSIPKGSDRIQLYLNAKDAKLLEGLVPEESRDWQIRIDDSLASGGARVVTDTSVVDFSVEKRLENYLEKIASFGESDLQELEPIPNYEADKGATDE